MRIVLIGGFLTSLSCAAGAPRPGRSSEQAVQRVLAHTCAVCHNAKLASGGMNITPYLDRASLASKREAWERIVAKVAAGEMPPKGAPRPPQEQLDALVN